MNNEVTNFMYYMYNKWCISEAKFLFGESLGNHIYEKWAEKREYSIDQNLSWYAELDKHCRQKIVDRANELYNKLNIKNHETNKVFEQDEQQSRNHLDWNGW